MTDLSVIRACYRSPKKDPAAMSPNVHGLFSGEIRDTCFSRFAVKAPRLVSDWHAFTFDAETSAPPCIPKGTHSSHRTYDHFVADGEWVGHLVSQCGRA